MMPTYFKKCLIVLTVALLFIAPAQSSARDSNRPIIIPTHNWSSQIVMSHVVGRLFEKIGNNVSYRPSDSQAVYELIRRGDATIALEIWQGIFSKSFYAAMDKGGIIDAGNHEVKTRIEWWYPAYVAELCPDLPDWKALNKCAKVFATADTAPKGRYLDGPADWHGQETKDRIAALNMDFHPIFATSASAIWKELASAAKAKQAIVLYNWSPNFTDLVYGGDFIKFPDYYEGCQKPQGGDGACGSPPAGWLKKAAYYRMPKIWPAAYKLLTRISFNKIQIATMAKLVDIDKLTHEQAADKWLADNQNVWQHWLQ